MVTRVDVAGYRNTVNDLSTVAAADTKRLLNEIADLSPVETRNTLIEVLPQVVSPYSQAAAQVSAVWYEDLRSEVTAAPYVAVADQPVTSVQVRSLVRYGVSPLFGQSDAAALTLLAGSIQRLIANAARATIQDNVLRDSIRVGYARVPQPGCCSFCGLMASRGSAYNSAASAGSVVGRGVDSSIALDETGRRRAGYIGGVGGGVKARGNQDIGRRFHDNCRCTVVPVFAGADNSYVADVQGMYLDMYRQVVGRELSAYSLKDPANLQFNSTSFKETLKNWRAEFGTK